jgi:hypothetical protein
MAWNWYDFAYAPWTIGKFVWEMFKPQKDQEPGRPPQMSAQGGAVPIVFGKTRITMDIVYFSCVLNGKMWDVAAVLGLCEGPITGVARCWRDKNVMATPGEYGSIVYTGTRPTQTAWTVPAAGDQRGYPGLAYLTANGKVTPNQWQGFGQSSFEVQGLLYATGDVTKGDADPSQVVDVLIRDRVAAGSSYRVGVGVPFDVRVSTGRDGLAASSYARYVSQLGFWLSPALTDRRPAAEHVKDILEASNATCLWTGGLLEIVPLGDTASGTFTPDLTVQYALTPDDLVGGRVEMELGAVSDVYNVCPVEYLDREPAASAADTGHAYNVAIESDPEPVDSASRGEMKADAVKMHAICQRGIAVQISRIRAQQMVRVRNRYHFRLPWRFARLEPLDFVTMTDIRLGLSTVAMRIEEISEDEEHVLDVTAIEWPFGVGHAVAHTTTSSDGPLPAEMQALTAAQQAHSMALRNWADTTIPAGTYQSVSSDDTLIVALGLAGVTSFSTNFGETWTSAATPPGADVYSCIHDGSKFVAVGNNWAWTSTDGDVWQARVVPAGVYMGVATNGSTIVAVGQNVCASSTNGTSWTSRTIPAGYYTKVAWNGSVFCAIGHNVSSSCATSPDGITWTSRTAPDQARYIVAGGSRFVASGNGGSYWSNDGIAWTAGSGTPAPTSPLIWTGAIFASVGGSGVSTSPDGREWSFVSFGSYFTTSPLTWTGRRAVAAGGRAIYT